jgi:hypothetical protein
MVYSAGKEWSNRRPWWCRPRSSALGVLARGARNAAVVAGRGVDRLGVAGVAPAGSRVGVCTAQQGRRVPFFCGYRRRR